MGTRPTTPPTEVQKTLVQLPNYRGMGGHGVENHGGHGDHTQVSKGPQSKGSSRQVVLSHGHFPVCYRLRLFFALSPTQKKKGNH